MKILYTIICIAVSSTIFAFSHNDLEQKEAKIVKKILEKIFESKEYQITHKDQEIDNSHTQLVHKYRQVLDQPLIKKPFEYTRNKNKRKLLNPRQQYVFKIVDTQTRTWEISNKVKYKRDSDSPLRLLPAYTFHTTQDGFIRDELPFERSRYVEPNLKSIEVDPKDHRVLLTYGAGENEIIEIPAAFHAEEQVPTGADYLPISLSFEHKKNHFNYYMVVVAVGYSHGGLSYHFVLSHKEGPKVWNEFTVTKKIASNSSPISGVKFQSYSFMAQGLSVSAVAASFKGGFFYHFYPHSNYLSHQPGFPDFKVTKKDADIVADITANTQE